MTIVDPLAALIVYLKANAGVAALASTRIYGGELPQSEAEAQPRAAIVCHYTGGVPENDVRIQRPRIDVTCYAATQMSASTLYLAVVEALKRMTRGSRNDTLLHTALQVGGPILDRDPDTHWPFCWSSWTLVSGEESTA